MNAAWIFGIHSLILMCWGHLSSHEPQPVHADALLASGVWYMYWTFPASKLPNMTDLL